MGFKQILENELESLNQDEKEALKAAIEATSNAHAPYSNYQVGAALLLEDGTIINGSNQENIAYPSGICAERSALFAYGSSKKESKIKILAIIAKDSTGEYAENCSPCGACRQAMVEYERLQKTPYKVIFCYNSKIEIVTSSTALMPFPFHF